MLVVFFTGIAPKEYLHELILHHHDAIHPDYKKGQFEFSRKHSHCGFLGFAFGPFVAQEKQYIAFTESIAFSAFLISEYHFFYHSAPKTPSLRGPPDAFTV